MNNLNNNSIYSLDDKKILILSGPTATGKSDLALEIVKRYSQVEIVNFDSLLFYRELNIGTAKPDQDLLAIYPHHLVNISSAKTPLNAHDFETRALKCIDELFLAHKIPLLVGGSGFYLRALLHGMYQSPTTPAIITQQSDKLYEESGIKPFLEILRLNDFKSFEKLHPNDHYRIRRAVEHFWTHGSAFSLEKQKHDEQNKNALSSCKQLHFYLDIDKEAHFKIIQNRTLKMLERNLIKEVTHLLIEGGFSGEERPLKSIGYKEIVDYLKLPDEAKNLTQTIDLINISTRQLAKAQRTWFKKIENKVNLNPMCENQKAQMFLEMDEFIHPF